MDCFFAAIEERDNPAIKGKPVCVGGLKEKRGVISAANYLARKFGIHSAMSSAKALVLCPNLVLIPPNIEKYKNVSSRIRKIFFEYTEKVEPLSLDEAYLDVSKCTFFNNSATLIAKDIRNKIFKAENLYASAGVSYNKFLAKIASDWNKPNGQFVISPKDAINFISKLKIEKVFGVGPKTSKKLHNLGVNVCADLQKFSVEQLVYHFGKFGKTLHNLCRGIDDREVEPNRIRKSLSVEQTFDKDLETTEECKNKMKLLLLRLEARLNSNDLKEFRKIFIKIKFDDFSITTVETITSDLNLFIINNLLNDGLLRGNGKNVRLLGVGVRFLQNENNNVDGISVEKIDGEQLLLWNDE